MIRISLNEPASIDSLLDPAAYAEIVG